MYEYNICNVPDKDIFKRQCAALENNIPNLKKGDLLHDVDDSQTQIYHKDGKKITVHNSYYIGALYISSEIRLEPYFNN